FAVDANGDGHKDIWNTKADIFASSANYLKQNGWNAAYPWGWQVTIPVGAKLSETKRPLSDWIKSGVHFKNGHIPNGQSATMARLIVPDGGNGRAYLVTSNYDTILSWNRSDYFALTVGLLSDFIAQQPEKTSGSFNQ
ncbi:MAG: lytic murein transglycosylase, partial [Methylomonas sp.]|nr:lytic murein transglycosylase [Methylomonas sp.]